MTIDLSRTLESLGDYVCISVGLASVLSEHTRLILQEHLIEVSRGNYAFNVLVPLEDRITMEYPVFRVNGERYALMTFDLLNFGRGVYVTGRDNHSTNQEMYVSFEDSIGKLVRALELYTGV